MVVYDSYYGTREVQGTLFDRGVKFIASLNTQWWREYVYLIRNHEGVLTETGAIGSGCFYSKNQKKVGNTTHLMLELSRSYVDKDKKLTATNAMEPQKRHAREPRGTFKAERCQVASLRAEYENNFNTVDLFNRRLFTYAYRRAGGMRHGTKWYTSLWDYLLTSATINALHIYVELQCIQDEAKDDVDVPEQVKEAVQDNNIDVSEESEEDLEDIEEDLDDNIFNDPRKRSKSRKRYGSKSDMVVYALCAAKELAVLSDKPAFYRIANGQYVRRNSMKQSTIDSRNSSRRSSSSRRASVSSVQYDAVDSVDEQSSDTENEEKMENILNKKRKI